MNQPGPYRYAVIGTRGDAHTRPTQQGSSYTPTQYMVNGQMRPLAVPTRDGETEGTSQQDDSDEDDESSDDTTVDSADDGPEEPAQDEADDDAESDDDSDEESAEDEPVPSDPEFENDSDEESEEGLRSILKSTVSTGKCSHERRVRYVGNIKSNTEGTSRKRKKKATFGSGRSEKENSDWWDILDPKAKAFEEAEAEAKARARADSDKTSQSRRRSTVVDMGRRAYTRPR